MDIGSKSGYPSSALSNFAPHPFKIDGVLCNSMEGFLQSLKFEQVHIQETVCLLIGLEAKRRGRSRNKRWQGLQTLWWKGKAYPRRSEEYQRLLDRAYKELASNPGFQRALLATGEATLTHSIGSRDESKTVLTEREFCSRLTKLRKELQNDRQA